MAVANGSRKNPKKKLEAGPIRRFRHENISRKTGPTENRPGAIEGRIKIKRRWFWPEPVGVYPRTPFEIGQVDGGARRQACRHCRTRATITGDHGAPVAAIRLIMNALSSAGGKVTATILQAGIG